jgi:hypothetical protein
MAELQTRLTEQLANLSRNHDLEGRQLHAAPLVDLHPLPG